MGGLASRGARRGREAAPKALWGVGEGRGALRLGEESQPRGGGGPSGCPRPPVCGTPRPEGLAPSRIPSRVRRAPS